MAYDWIALNPVGVALSTVLDELGVSRFVQLLERAQGGLGFIGMRLPTARTRTATPARHCSGRSLIMTDRDETLWAGWVIAGPEYRVFFSGDTAMFPGFATIGECLGPFDATMIEVGAYDRLWADVYLGPEQAIRAHQMIYTARRDGRAFWSLVARGGGLPIGSDRAERDDPKQS